MARITIEVPDSIMARLNERAQAWGHDSVETMLRLMAEIEADQINDDKVKRFVALIDEGRNSPAGPLEPGHFDKKIEELRQRFARHAEPVESGACI